MSSSHRPTLDHHTPTVATVAGSVPLVEVVAAAIVDDLTAPTRVLAARRTSPAALAGRWELPGGKVEPGESRHEALHRELREELGVDVQLGEQVAGPRENGRWLLVETSKRRLEMAVWTACITGGTPSPLEDHDELRWLTSDTLTDVPWLDSNAAIVEALAQRLRPGDG